MLQCQNSFFICLSLRADDDDDDNDAAATDCDCGAGLLCCSPPSFSAAPVRAVQAWHCMARVRLLLSLDCAVRLQIGLPLP